MTTDITELAQSMKAAAKKATPGEWWADEVKNEGCYGSGDDCVEGFTSYAIYGSDGKTLFDSLNSDAACISEEYDGEGHVAWDETAQRNAEFIALANPANVSALVEALEKTQQRIDELLPSSGNMLMPALEGLSRDHLLVTTQTAVDNYSALHTKWLEDRQRIAELESRTVNVENLQESAYRAGLTAGWNLGLTNNNDGFNKCLAAHAAGIKVEAE
ncbi:Uncharacterised protein [Klebsiella pneumoniae]|nr:Uncharacterised protein [Klebsiella pneumoniae]